VTPALPGLTADSPEGRLVGGPIPQRQDLVAMANPLRYIDASAPPILLMHGDRDDYVPLASSQRFHGALVSHGAPAFLHVVKDGHHNAYLWGDHHLRLVQEFFEWHLRS
jgi:dipeptidyl aminopeptidase/acylaminoacyl peptidase